MNRRKSMLEEKKHSGSSVLCEGKMYSETEE